MTPFVWKNCYADVQAWRHDQTIREFVRDVVKPAIAVLDDKITALSLSDVPAREFIQTDTEDVRRETKLAFALSVQSIWERQFRGYLTGCASELQPEVNLKRKIQRAEWLDLCKLFAELRGIALSQFPSYEALRTLHLLGNACRHGDGPSTIELYERRPELWSSAPRLYEDIIGAPTPGPPPVQLMEIPVSIIEELSEAAASFWEDQGYIYNESIERKHESLEARLATIRPHRTWRPMMGDGVQHDPAEPT